MACEGGRVKRCPADESHEVGWRHCNVCEPPRVVQALCAKCSLWFSAPGIAQHERTCQPAKRQRMDPASGAGSEEEDEEQDDEAPGALRVVYVQSQKEGERGRLEFVDETLFAAGAAPWLTVHRAVTAGLWWVDAYDALFAALLQRGKGAIRLVHVVRDRKSVRDHISEQRAFLAGEAAFDVLVWPNWLFELLHVGKTLAALHEWVELLRQYERVHRCVVFPPIEYVLFFARKDVWMCAHVRLPPSVHIIPTHYIYPATVSGKKWRASVVAFARKQQTKRLVVKRAVGECGHQVWEEVTVVDGGTKLSGLPAKLDPLPHLVQPFVEDFAKERELRLYMVRGALWLGLESWWDGPDKLRYDSWDESKFPGARAAAERVAQLLAQECCADAGHFVRLDMVRRLSDGGWWLNEAEFFGNAHLLLKTIPEAQAQEAFNTMVGALQRWLVAVARSAK